jgi:hypothetical protein
MTAMFSDNDSRAVVANLAARCLDEELHKSRPFGVKAGGVPQGTWFFAFKGGTLEDTARQLTEMINRGGKP